MYLNFTEVFLTLKFDWKDPNVLGYPEMWLGQVYYGEWRGQEVAVKVMSAEASHQNVVLQEVSIICALLHLSLSSFDVQESPVCSKDTQSCAQRPHVIRALNVLLSWWCSSSGRW